LGILGSGMGRGAVKSSPKKIMHHLLRLLLLLYVSRPS
jgi:hypothetical protein